MKKTFLTNLVFLLFINLLVKPFYVFGIDRTVQNVLGTENYGFYFVLFNFSLALQIILDVGLQNFNNREIARHRFLINKYFSRIVPLKLFLGVVYAVVCLLVGFFIGFNQAQFKLLLLLIVNQFLASFILYVRSNISALHRFKADGIVSVTDKLLMIGLCSLFLFNRAWQPYFSIRVFILLQTASYVFTLLLSVGILWRHLDTFKPRFNYRYYMAFLKKSYVFALLILLMSFYYRADSVLIERLLDNGNYHAGIYAQSFRIVDALNVVGFLFASLLLPIFASMIKKNESVGELVNLSARILFTGIFLVAVPASFYGFELLDLLYHDATPYSASIFGYLMVSLMCFSLTYVFGTLLTANGSLKALNIIAGLSVILNIGLNLIIIPRLQATGAAITSMLTQGFVLILQVIACLLIFKFTVPVKAILQIALYVLISLGVCFSVQQWLDLPWLQKWLLSVAAVSLLAIAIRVIQPKEMLKVVQYDT